MSALDKLVIEVMQWRDDLFEALRRDHDSPPPEIDPSTITTHTASDGHTFKTYAVPEGEVHRLVGTYHPETRMNGIRSEVIRELHSHGLLSTLDSKVDELCNSHKAAIDDALKAGDEGRRTYTPGIWERVNNALNALIPYAEGLRNDETTKGKVPADESYETPLKEPRKWTMETAEFAVCRYVVDHQKVYDTLKAECADSNEAARKANELFGRNVIAEKTGVTKSMVSKTDTWKKIKQDFGWGNRAIGKPAKVGTDKGLDDASAVMGDTTVGTVKKNELFRRIRKAMPEEAAEGLITNVEIGKTSLEEAETIVEIAETQDE